RFLTAPTLTQRSDRRIYASAADNPTPAAPRLAPLPPHPLAPDDGNGGPMHITEVDKGMLGANGIGTLAVAIGQIAAVRRHPEPSGTNRASPGRSGRLGIRSPRPEALTASPSPGTP